MDFLFSDDGSSPICSASSSRALVVADQGSASHQRRQARHLDDQASAFLSMSPHRRTASCPPVPAASERPSHGGRGRYPKESTSFIFGMFSASSSKKAKTWKETRSEGVHNFYEDPLATRDPILPAKWKEYRDKDGLEYYAGPVRGSATYDRPPVPAKPTKKCDYDLTREYQSPGIVATNIFSTCRYRCNGGMNFFGPGMVFREPITGYVHVKVADRSISGKSALPVFGQDDLADDRQILAPLPEKGEEVIADADAWVKDGVMSRGPRPSKPFCASEFDLLPHRYEITVTDPNINPENNGEGTNFIGRIILRSHNHPGFTQNLPGDDHLDKMGGACIIL